MYTHFRFKSAVLALNSLASLPLQIHCPGFTEAPCPRNVAVNPLSLHTETPSVAVWAKPSWIRLPYRNTHMNPPLGPQGPSEVFVVLGHSSSAS